MTVSNQFSSGKLSEINIDAANKTPINQLPKCRMLSILNYLSPRDTAVLHSVQRSWKNLLWSNGRLNLGFTDINDGDLAKVIERYKDKGITSINLRYSQITDQGLECLKGLPLTKLSLESCRITDQAIKQLKNFSQLQRLDLTNCENMGDEWLKILKDLPLQQLILLATRRGYHITDQGLEHLKDLPLKKLNLAGHINITDKGLKHLKNLPLEHLDLEHCDKIQEPERMGEVLPISNYFHKSDFLIAGNPARKNEDYRDLYQIMLQYL